VPVVGFIWLIYICSNTKCKYHNQNLEMVSAYASYCCTSHYSPHSNTCYHNWHHTGTGPDDFHNESVTEVSGEFIVS